MGSFDPAFVGRFGMDRTAHEPLDQLAAPVHISNRFYHQRDRTLESLEDAAQPAQVARENLERAAGDFVSGTVLCRGRVSFTRLQPEILSSVLDHAYEYYAIPCRP